MASVRKNQRYEPDVGEAEIHFRRLKGRIRFAIANNKSELNFRKLEHLAAIPAEIGQLKSLKRLHLNKTQVTDLRPLSSLKKLTLINIAGLPLQNVAPLANLPGLEDLIAHSINVSDFSAIAELSNLKSLDISGTLARNVSFLRRLNNLRELNLDHLELDDIEALADLTALTSLSLRGTRVRDIGALAKLTKLTNLNLSGTRVADLSPLRHHTALQDEAARHYYFGYDGVLRFENTPAAMTSPFREILLLREKAAHTIEPINFVRRQHGLPEHFPERYNRPASIETIFEGAVGRAPLPPEIPRAAPAAIEPVILAGRISLPDHAIPADLDEAGRDAALIALKIELGELAADVAGEANIDRRAAGLLRSVADLVPQVGPPQDVLFRLAHKEEVLIAYAATVHREWPDVLGSRYQVLCRQFDRTMRQFPKWREFKRNAAKDQLTREQLAIAGSITSDVVDALGSNDAQPFVDPRLPEALEELAAPLKPRQQAEAGDIIEAGKELLVEDVVESINNILKRVADVALAAGLTGKQAAEHYTKGLAEGLIDAAKKQGPKDGAALLKWARRFLVSGAGLATAGAFIQRLIQVFPEKFAWLQAVLRFITPL